MAELVESAESWGPFPLPHPSLHPQCCGAGLHWLLLLRGLGGHPPNLRRSLPVVLLGRGRGGHWYPLQHKVGNAVGCHHAF